MKTKFRGIPLKVDINQNLSKLYEGIEYKEFWQERSRKELDLLEHAIVKDLLPASGKRVVDIGCGFGRLADCYLDRFEQVIMVDGSMSLLQQARETTQGRAHYVAADANRLPFRDASFDCVMMIRVFHHLNDSQHVVSEYRRLLGGDATLVFNYCNKRSMRQILHWLSGRARENPFSHETSAPGSEFMRHHPAYISELLEQFGFHDVVYRGAGIMDKVAGRLGAIERFVPSGEQLAPFFGAAKLAPWINCRTTVQGKPLRAGENLVDLLACVSCGGDLDLAEEAYQCQACGQSYPIVDGIPDFRM